MFVVMEAVVLPTGRKPYEDNVCTCCTRTMRSIGASAYLQHSVLFSLWVHTVFQAKGHYNTSTRINRTSTWYLRVYCIVEFAIGI